MRTLHRLVLAFAVLAGRVVQPEQSHAVQGHAQAQYLARAEVTVRLRGQHFVFAKRLQGHGLKHT